MKFLNNKTVDRTSGMTEIGSATLQYNFSEPGPITVRIENVGNTPAFTEFKTIVYQNHSTMSHSDNNNNNQDNRISALPIAVAVIILLYKKGII